MYLSICLYVNMYVRIYAYMCVYIYIYIYVYVRTRVAHETWSRFLSWSFNTQRARHACNMGPISRCGPEALGGVFNQYYESTAEEDVLPVGKTQMSLRNLISLLCCHC